MTSTPAPPSIVEQVVTLVARHALSALAGALVTAGALDKDASAQFVTIGAGLATWAVSAALSYWQKRVAAKRLAAAIAAPSNAAKP